MGAVSLLSFISFSEVPVEHETLKSGRDRTITDDDTGRTDVKVEIFM